jgi:DNA-binding transcriptional LysR family regulator
VAFVVGVTPGKWARVWAERLPGHPLDLLPMAQDDALAALLTGREAGGADAALLRLPITHESLSAIPLYAEQPVVVAPKDHAAEALDSLTLADLAAENVLDLPWAEAVELVAANVGVAIMPQSVARALSRRDVIARPVTDAAETRIALAWVTDGSTPAIEEFIGIVRGRTANSSRGTPTPPTEKSARSDKKPDKKPKPGAKPKPRPRQSGRRR